MKIYSLPYGRGLVMVRPSPTEHLPCARTGAVRSVHTWDDLRVGGVRFAVDVGVAHLWDRADGVGVRFWRYLGGPPTHRFEGTGPYVWLECQPGDWPRTELDAIVARRVAVLPWPEQEQEQEQEQEGH